MIQCHRTYCKSRGFFLLPKLLIFSCQQLTAFDVIAARSLAVTICSSPHPSARQRLLPARFLPGPFPGCALYPPAARTFLPLAHHWLATGHTWPSQTCAGPLGAPFPVGKQREHGGMSQQSALPASRGRRRSLPELQIAPSSCGFTWERGESHRVRLRWMRCFDRLPAGARGEPPGRLSLCHGVSPSWHQVSDSDTEL